MYLYNEKVLLVDLAAGTVQAEPLPDEVAEECVGGAGLAARLLEEAGGDAVVLATGPLTGTLFPGAALAVLARVGEDGAPLLASLSLFMGSEVKYAGFDAIIIKGSSPRPVYLWVHDGLASLEDAADLAGLDTWQTSDTIKGDKGDTVVQVLAVGPAGEAGSSAAQVVANYWATDDRAGFGAALGTKGVKAIAVRGLGLIDVEEPEDLFERSLELGTAVAAAAPAQGIAGPDAGLQAWLAPMVHRHRGCFSCPLACFTYLKYREDPAEMAPVAEEPGFLATDREALQALHAAGLPAEGSLQLLEAAARRGLAPLAVARMAAVKASTDVALLAEVESAGQPACGTSAPSQAAALGFIVGVCPTVVAAAPILDEEQLLEALRLGSGLELEPGALAALLPQGALAPAVGA